jgi:hypothetical protein
MTREDFIQRAVLNAAPWCKDPCSSPERDVLPIIEQANAMYEIVESQLSLIYRSKGHCTLTGYWKGCVGLSGAFTC